MLSQSDPPARDPSGRLHNGPVQRRSGSLATLGAYLGTAGVWGASFLFMKVALTGLSAPQVALTRGILGALMLTLLMALTRRRWPSEPVLWRHLAVIAVLLGVGPFLLFAWAGQYLPSGLSAILNATTPIWTAVLTALAVPAVRLGGLQVVGIAVGAVGVAVVMGIWKVVSDPAFGASVPAQLACLAATFCYGSGFAYLRRFVTGRYPYDPLTLAATQIALAGALSLLLAPLLARGAVSLSWPVVGSMVALGALGTGLAYVWNMRVINDWGPVAASTVTYLHPVVGVGLGMMVLGEQLHWYEPVGALVVVVGVVLAQGRRTPRVAGRGKRPPLD